jgi:multidrug resistance protein
MQEQTRPQEQGLWLLVVLGTLLGFASISTDLYLPALPRMAEALQAEQSALELTVSGYLMGFSAGQLLWGPISDRYGRRGPMAAGLVIFVLGAAGCALSTTAGQLILWRVVQALGASAGVVLARAMVRDLYDRNRAARVLSTLMTVMAVAPLMGPTVGGQILRVADWPAIFWTLVAIGLATLLALTTIPETLPRDRRTAEPMGQALAGYGGLLGNHRLMGYAAAGGFYFVGVFAYVAGTPFAFISYHGLSSQLYGLLRRRDRGAHGHEPRQLAAGDAGGQRPDAVGRLSRSGGERPPRGARGGDRPGRDRESGRGPIPVRRYERLYQRQHGLRRAGERVGARRRGVCPRGSGPVWRWRPRVGARWCLRRWHSVAAGLGRGSVRPWHLGERSLGPPVASLMTVPTLVQKSDLCTARPTLVCKALLDRKPRVVEYTLEA